MAYLPENHRCYCCGTDLGPDDGDGECSACSSAFEQIGGFIERKEQALRAACQMALEHGEKKKYTWRHVRATLQQALADYPSQGDKMEGHDPDALLYELEPYLWEDVMRLTEAELAELAAMGLRVAAPNEPRFWVELSTGRKPWVAAQ
jgi:hypothetical protein